MTLSGRDGGWPYCAFWDWSLAVYGRPGVEAACLALQDRHGLDVNLLLFAVWAGTRGTILSPEAMGEAAQRVGRWHAEIVRPLRALRRRLKGDPHGLDPTLAAEMRRRIAAVELDAEHAEQLGLAALAPIQPGAAEEAAGDAVSVNLATFAAAIGIAWSEADRGDLETIAAAAAAR